MTHLSIRLGRAATVAALVTACAKEEARNPDSTAATKANQMAPAPTDSTTAAPPTVRGTVERITDSTLAIKTTDGSVTVKIERPLQVYARAAGTLKDVTPNAFVGVTSVPSPDGSQTATEIHVFPEQLRGLGEGSRPMTPQPGAPSSKMTNGTVSGSQMTNGTVGGSRMTNGTVATNGGASTITVSYAGGTQTIAVPSTVTVTKIAPSNQKLTAGLNVVALTKKNADGSQTTNTVLLSPAKR